MSDEELDPLKAAIWQALIPFQEELVATGGVTFMGLRNAIACAVEPFIEQHRSDAVEWHVEYNQARQEKNEAIAENLKLRADIASYERTMQVIATLPASD